MGSKLLTERFQFSGGKVCRESGTITDCLICGLVSENDRDYPWGAGLRGSHTKYEGAPSNCDHGRDEVIDRRLGWFTDVKPDAEGKPRGTFNLLKSHPMYERVMEAAERNPRLFGFSHVIEAKTSRKNGREIVESIDRVISIDLVAGPATTSSFFEHKSKGRTVGITAKQLAEWVTRHAGSTLADITRAKRFAEDMGAMGMGDAPVMDAAPADDAEPGDGLKSGIKAGIMELIDAALEDPSTAAETLKKIKTLLNAHADVSGNGKAADAADEPAAKESKLPKLKDVIAECKAQKLDNPPGELLEQLAGSPDADARTFMIAQELRAQKATTREHVQSAGRGQVRTEQTVDEGKGGEKTATVDECKARMKG